MAGIFIAAGVASGALAGLIIGLLGAAVAAWVGGISTGVVLAIVGIGVVLDACNLAFGWPSPITSGRQVPQEWGRLFDARLVAVLYGSRLGVGPLTILTTWTWWSVTVAGGLVGLGPAMVVGATFGFVRLLTTLTVSVWSGLGPTGVQSEHHAQLFGRLRARRRPNWIALNGVGLAAIAAMVLSGCGGQSVEPAASPTASAVVDDADSAPPSGPVDPSQAEISSLGTVDHRAGPTDGPSSEPSQSKVLNPVELEDVVRSPGAELDTTEGSSVDDDGDVVTLSSAPEALEASLLEGIDGYEPVTGSDADRHLDLTAAASLQPDPSEEIALLETRGFAGGWTRAFRSPANDVAVVSVYHFEDAAEAEFYLEDGLITIGGYGGKFFDLEGQPGVRGFIQQFTETQDGTREELVSLGASFQEGPRWYIVYFVGSAETVTAEVLIPAIDAQRQLART